VRDYLRVISEYACFSGSWQVGETKISAGGVSYACVNPTRYSPHASLACFRTRPTRSSPELTPATRTQYSGSTVSPGSSALQILLTLFKFVALFKISDIIQIWNMNSARALTKEWLRHPNFLLFKALTIG